VNCKPNILLSQTAKQISKQLLESAKRDIEPSLNWAADQMEALVPVDFATVGDSVSNSWSNQSMISEKIQLFPITDIRPEIVKALFILGRLVIKALKPGLSEAVVHCKSVFPYHSVEKSYI
jgi:hypothetical protein